MTIPTKPAERPTFRLTLRPEPGVTHEKGPGWKAPPTARKSVILADRSPHTKRRRPEQALQRAVFEHLRLRAAPDVFAFHPANGGWRTAVEGAILKGMGVVPGTPDVVAIKGGKVFGLELKADTGHLTDIQRTTHERMRAAGALVGVAHGIDQALEWLEDHELLRGRAST
jgi:hypothetical protein